ncbi:MAG: acetate--CoA ligase family protein [Thermodesulfovibrionales bacterium]
MSFLRTFFSPSSVALVGASPSEAKLGGVIMKNLLLFRGPVHPVSPKHAEIMGRTCFASPAELPPVDLVFIIRPAADVPGIMRALKGRTGCCVVMSAGFAESGGQALQDEVRTAAREAGIRFLGPNCMGIFRPAKKLDGLFLSHTRLKRPKSGRIGVISQSGAVLSCLLGAVREAGAGVSAAVGYGNAADIGEAELYDHFGSDRGTGVVVSYLESVGDGRRFLQAAERLVSRKPLLVLKAGKAESGRRAAFSHTGRLAGRYEVFRSLLRQSGIPEASDFDELLDGAAALAVQKPSSGNRVCIVTNGGGAGVLAADECVRQGLAVVPLDQEQKERLSKLFPPFYGIANPIDLTAQVQDEDYASAVKALAQDFDGFLVIAIPNVSGITENLANIVGRTCAEVRRPVVAHIASGGIASRLTGMLRRNRIPVYPSPERAVRGLKFLLKKKD